MAWVACRIGTVVGIGPMARAEKSPVVVRGGHGFHAVVVKMMTVGWELG